MLHDDIPHILLYILIWLIFRFPTVKYANTKHGGAGGIILWALLTVFLVCRWPQHIPWLSWIWIFCQWPQPILWLFFRWPQPILLLSWMWIFCRWPQPILSLFWIRIFWMTLAHSVIVLNEDFLDDLNSFCLCICIEWGFFWMTLTHSVIFLNVEFLKMTLTHSVIFLNVDFCRWPQPILSSQTG